MTDPVGVVRGRIMARITRPDRQVYIARAVLANRSYVEAHFDSRDHIDIGGGEVVQIDHDRVTLLNGAATYIPSLYGVYERGAGPATEDITGHERAYAARRAKGYATVAYERYANGLWFLRVTTDRGSYDVPRIPGEDVSDFLRVAGLGP